MPFLERVGLLFSFVLIFAVLFLLIIMDFLLHVTLSGSLYELSLLSCSLTDGSNINVKVGNVNIHSVELHPWDGLSFFLCLLALTSGSPAVRIADSLQ